MRLLLALVVLLLVLFADPALAKRKNKGKGRAKRGANFHEQKLQADPRNLDAPGSVTADGHRESDADAAEVRALHLYA
jgi:hypothetical protein